MNEYTEEEKKITGNYLYGGKRHDAICDELQKSFMFSEVQINDISMGVWKGIESEKKCNDETIKNLKKCLRKFLLVLKDVEKMDTKSTLKFTDLIDELVKIDF